MMLFSAGSLVFPADSFFFDFFFHFYGFLRAFFVFFCSDRGVYCFWQQKTMTMDKTSESSRATACSLRLALL
jgi:hypothetical protein